MIALKRACVRRGGVTTVPVKADDKIGEMTRDELETMIRTIANEQREQPKFYKVKSVKADHRFSRARRPALME